MKTTDGSELATPPSSALFIPPHIKRDDEGALLLYPYRVKVFVKNPRKKFRRIPGLAKSIERTGKQVQPGIVRLIVGDPNFDAELVEGERRIRALKLLFDADPKWRFRAFPNTSIRDMKSHFKESFVANFCREDYDCMEIARGLQQLIDDGETQASAALMAGGKSQTWVSQHLSLLKLDPKVQEMLVPGENEEEDEGRRLSFTLALKLTAYPPDLQIKTAQEITAGQMSQVKARRHILQTGRKIGRMALVSRKHPNAGFQSLMMLSENLGDRLGIFLDMSKEETAKMLAGAPKPAKALLARRLNGLVKDLGVLIASLEKEAESAA